MVRQLLSAGGKGRSDPEEVGGVRVFGVPTVSDRIAQTVAKMRLEPILEPVFDENSFGYRPGKSAHDALAITRKRCWQYDWVVEFDIRGLFDARFILPPGLLDLAEEGGLALYRFDP